jgi:serpin B
MRVPISGLVALVAGAAAIGCGELIEGPIEQLPRDLSLAEGKLIESDNRFAFNLFREINGLEPETNVFISPLSAAMALGMAYNGSAGSTREAMQQTLELQEMAPDEVNESYRSLIDLLGNLDPRVEFLLANSIWYRNTMTFEPQFIDLNREFFDAEVSALDFDSPSASQTINGWVNDNTNGKITEIVPAPIPAEMIMYLINAIYFKGDWRYQFDESLTRDAPFELVDGSETTVDMMSYREKSPLRVYTDSDVQVVDLPYGGWAYSMTIILPATAQGIGDVVEGLTQEQWNGWIAALDSASLVVSMPRFQLEYELELNNVLTALGMGVAFSPDSADFTLLYNGPAGRAYISTVTHKTFVDVNEEGTEAAAATSVGVGATSAGPMPIVIDRPFVLAIRERHSGTVLFLGRVMDPN